MNILSCKALEFANEFVDFLRTCKSYPFRWAPVISLASLGSLGSLVHDALFIEFDSNVAGAVPVCEPLSTAALNASMTVLAGLFDWCTARFHKRSKVPLPQRLTMRSANVISFHSFKMACPLMHTAP